MKIIVLGMDMRIGRGFFRKGKGGWLRCLGSGMFCRWLRGGIGLEGIVIV